MGARFTRAGTRRRHQRIAQVVVKSMVTVQEGVARHLQQAYGKAAYQREPERASPKKPSRSSTQILTDLYRKMDELISQIDVSDESPGKKAVAYGQVARILQQLQRAEKAANVTIDNKALDEMEPHELERLIREALKIKEGGRGISRAPDSDQASEGRFPFSGDCEGVNTNTLSQNKKTNPAPKNKKQQARAYKSVEARRQKNKKHKSSASIPHSPTSVAEDVDAILDEIVQGL